MTRVNKYEVVCADVWSVDPYVVVSSFTRNTPYEVEARHLWESLVEFTVPHIIFGLENKGPWIANCKAANYVILQAFQWFPDRNVVWLDADSRVRKPPTLFDQYGYDIGVYRPEWPPGSGEIECRTGTIFFRNTFAVREFFREYIRATETLPAEFMPEKYFGKCVENSGLNYDPAFPAEYCAVRKHEGGMLEAGINLSDVVILQEQAMKHYVKKINRETPSLKSAKPTG
jgi:hypothetical protein